MSPSVLFIVFNRPEPTASVFEAIRQARPPRLYVAADGPREGREGEAEQCAAVRLIATEVDWPCEVITLFRDANLGCRLAVSGAITWFFKHELEGIILEDDCLPHPTFFAYCAELLERYRGEPRVMCINGNNCQVQTKGLESSYYFSIYGHVWGWASWRRAWAHYDEQMKDWSPADAKPVLDRIDPSQEFRKYWTDIFQRTKRREIDTWDYQWIWACWRHGGLACTPSVNLISNIGFGPEATHTHNAEDALSRLPVREMVLPLCHPKLLMVNRRIDKFFTRDVFGIESRSLFTRVKGSIRCRLKRVVSAINRDE